METREVKETEIDLTVIFEILRKYVVLIIAIAVIFGAGAYLGTDFFIAKQYKASATLIVNNKINASTGGVNSNEVTAAKDLAEVYSLIIKSDSVMQPVIDNMELDLTCEQLKSAITVSSVNSTQIIEISLKSTDPTFAKKVLASIVKVAQPIIVDKVEAGSVKVIDDAKIANNGNPVGPDAKRNAVLGALVGLVIILFIVIVKELFNTKFKSENDITNALGLPLIGTIPMVDSKEFGR